jgi:hypothetical protein
MIFYPYDSMNISIKPVNIKKRKEKGSINYKSNIKNKIKKFIRLKKKKLSKYYTFISEI